MTQWAEITRPTSGRAQTGTHAHAPVPRHAALRPAWRLSGGPARCNAASVEPADARCRERPGAELSVTGPLRNGEE